MSTKGLTFQITHNINFGSNLLWPNISTNLMIYYFSKYWRIFQISQFARWNLFSRIYFRISMLFFHHHSMLSHFLLFFNFPKFFPAFPGFPWVLGTLNKQRKLLYVKNARWASATEKRVCIQIQVKTQRQTHTNINTHKHLIQTNTKKTIKLDISIPEKGIQF